MSTSHAAQPPQADASIQDHAHTLGVWSLLMLVFLIPAAIVSAVVSLFILGSADLEGSEPMSVQGTTGWIALLLGTAILMSPMLVGIVLGAKARKQGERLGTIGMVIDGVIFVGYLLLVFGNTLTQ
jgi:hypothetical protein